MASLQFTRMDERMLKTFGVSPLDPPEPNPHAVCEGVIDGLSAAYHNLTVECAETRGELRQTQARERIFRAQRNGLWVLVGVLTAAWAAWLGWWIYGVLQQ